MEDIYVKLRERYPAPEWALFFEVANGPGSHLRRYADAIAVSLFPSRGLDVHGFEIKTNRGDWLNELKNPGKAEEIASYCDFWWVVAGDEKVALKSEIPRNWGLLVDKGEKIQMVKRAERLEPKPLDRKFVAALLRRSDEWVSRELQNDERVIRAKGEGVEIGKKQAADQLKNEFCEAERLRGRIAEFEERSGINIDTYHTGIIGDAVKSFLYLRTDIDGLKQIEESANYIEGTVNQLRERAKVIRAAQELKIEQVEG